MKKSTPIWTRRNFVGTLAGAGAAFMAAPSLAFSTEHPKNAQGHLASTIFGIDTHSHLDVPFKPEDFAGQTYDLSGEMKKSGLAAICMTFQVDRPNLIQEGEAYERFLTCLDEMDKILLDNDMTRALNSADLEKAFKEQKPIVIQAVEGGHFIEGKLERIEIAYQRGLRHLGLLHDNQSFVPLGDIYTNEAKFGGLTEQGEEVIRECNRLGILIDLAHCSNDAINDALKISTKPVLISHTGLNTQLGTNEKTATMMMPRLISKEQAKLVANAGGVIGVWTHLAESPVEFANNIRALVDEVGPDHVCIGTDTKMAVPANQTGRQGNKTNTAWQNMSNGFFYTIVDAMKESGFSDSEISKIGGSNYKRIFDQATKK